ncbi:MAG: hypothetical protein PHC84_01235 [Clostridia bacterium]|nr:hypothetical protein [Clostridia bacterium]
MKKIILLVVLLIAVFTFTACSSPTPPGTSWADKEILVYDVKIDGVIVGELTSTLEREPADKTIGGTPYASATSRLTVTFTGTNNGDTIEIQSLLADFAPLATYKKVVSADKNYELTAVYNSKYYNYTLKQNGAETSDRIKAKAPYIDNDLLYTYLRCQSLASGINTVLNIPDAHSGTLQSLTAASQASETLTVPYPDGNKTVACYKVAITRNETPVGSSIFVYYTPDSAEYVIPGSIGSINDSVKIPVKIVENDVTYLIKSITVI